MQLVINNGRIDAFHVVRLSSKNILIFFGEKRRIGFLMDFGGRIQFPPSS